MAPYPCVSPTLARNERDPRERALAGRCGCLDSMPEDLGSQPAATAAVLRGMRRPAPASPAPPCSVCRSSRLHWLPDLYSHGEELRALRLRFWIGRREPGGLGVARFHFRRRTEGPVRAREFRHGAGARLAACTDRTHVSGDHE